MGLRIENNRPISIICNFVNIFETTVNTLLISQVKPSLIAPNQHWYLGNRSTKHVLPWMFSTRLYVIHWISDSKPVLYT